jgi:predicted ATPase/class 3 adenylate cyclase
MGGRDNGRGGFETRTLLFSDIEGSTRLHAALGDDYAGVLAAHRKLIREPVSLRHGVEHSTAGDGFFFVFRSARDALAAAFDAQLALRAYEWPPGMEVRVRMGLHAGEIGYTDDDVVGLAIHEAARIMDAAHGGQVLVSPVVRDLTAGAEPSGATLRSLGPHRLKDFDEPVELLQLCHSDLPSDFPPPRTRDAVVSLPAYRTSFVGRGGEVADVLSLLGAGRHVTLTGVGGSGKTRLALEVAALDAERHPDGVFFVDLAPLADPDHVLGALASGVSAQGDASDLEAMVLGYLSQRRALIVLDNCEHLIDACADVVDLVLTNCADIRVLATSREALQIDGEQTYSVPSLSVDEDAVMLFVSRAQAVRPEFVLNDASRDHVLAICRRLDGIPLAIELAGARVDHMSVADIAARLDERFELLIGGRRRRAQRQQTLQAAMDWSWALLGSDEQTLLRRLAVFAGSFTLEAAESICDVRPTLPSLASLKAKSLVQIEEDSTPTRYRLLETVRLYAQEKLVDADEAGDFRTRHRDWFAARVEGIPVDQWSDLGVSLRMILPDSANFRAAIDWTLSRDEPEALARLVLGQAVLWLQAGAYLEETERLLTLISEDARLPRSVRADALANRALAAIMAGNYALARPLAQASLDMDSSDRPFLFMAYWWLDRYDEGEAAALRTGAAAAARLCRVFATLPRIADDPLAAASIFEETIALAGDGWGLDQAFAEAGFVLAKLAAGDARTALDHMRDEFRWERLRKDPHFESFLGAIARHKVLLEAIALADLGRFDEAHLLLVETARYLLRDRYPIMLHDCIVAVAYMTFRRGAFAESLDLLAPAVRDTRLRLAPMYPFVFRFIEEVRAVAHVAGIATDLPSGAEFLAVAGRIMVEGRLPDPAFGEEIEAKLAAFVR